MHATPFAAVSAIVWRATDGVEPEDAHAAFQGHSYLYTTLLEWFARHSSCLASPRSLELLSCLARVTRLSCDHRAFGRSLVHELSLAGDELEAPTATTLRRLKLKRAFSQATPALATLLARAQQDATASDATASADLRLLYEWMGLAERPRILQEALELLFAPPDERSGTEQEARLGAASLVGWFYAFTSANSSAASIAAQILETASSLGRASLAAGSAWLQHSRSEFHAQPQLCIRMAWFWLLERCCASADSIQSDAAVVDALESLEYAFRRFAPAKPTHKRCAPLVARARTSFETLTLLVLLSRSFQVDAMAQLLSDLEWRWEVGMRTAQASQKMRLELQERFDVPIAWLKKIVHLMQTEQQPHRVASTLAKLAASNGPSASLSEQLATRLKRLTQASSMD